MFIPGKFVRQVPSRFNNTLFGYAPRQLVGLFALALFFPGGLFEYALFKGHLVVGVMGLLVWVPFLWAFLVLIHDDGRLRFWVSAPIMLIGHVLIALNFAGML